MWKNCENLLARLVLGLSVAASGPALSAEIFIPETSPQTMGRVAPVFQRSIELPSIARPPSQPDDVAKGKLRIGMRRNFSAPVKVDKQTVQQGEWYTLPDGSKLWAAHIIADGAEGLRVHVREVVLPEGVTLMVYSPDLNRSGATVDGGQMAGTREIWMPSVLGESVIFECRASADADLKDLSFTLDGVSHLYDSPAPSLEKAGTCLQDLACAGGWQDAGNGVARISFVENGSTFVCTGGLLWDGNGNGRYFLTAAHCIENPAVAATMEAYWFYQTAQCNGPAPSLSEATRTAGGADFVAGSSASDFALVRLRRSPPPGVFYLSWSASPPQNGETVTTIHHPGGKRKRLSVGTKIGEDQDYTKVRWTTGVTEPGSSGAPLFNSRGEIVGQLYGGSSSCSNPSGTDIFGRFDVTYQKVKAWLEPGYEPASASVQVPKGTFTGLFADSDKPTIGGSGVLTLKVASGNKFTGSIRMKSGKYGFTGKFNSTGYARLKVKRPRLSTMVISLQLDSSDTDRIAGEVSGTGRSVPIIANRSVYNGTTSKAPQTGRYTLAIPNAGGGDGYALAKIGKDGSVTLSAKLPGRGATTSTGFIAREGDFPLFLLLSSGREMLAGWIAFGAGYWSAPDGSASWVFSTGKIKALALNGSRFVVPPTSQPVLDSPGAVVRFGGGLGVEFTLKLNLKRKLSASNPGSKRISIAFNSNGTFSGSATGLVKGKSVTFSGVLLQNSKSGFGAFVGGSKKGGVRLVAD